MHKKVIRDTVYYYTSIRENGRVKTIYLGRTEEEALRKEEELKKSKSHATSKERGLLPDLIKFRLPIYLFIAVFIFLGFLFLRGVNVGYLTLSGPEKFLPGEKFNGTINLTFMGEEFYPKDTIIEAGIGDQINKMELRQLLVESGIEMGQGEGEYYVIGSELAGSGEGFGIGGKKKIFPEVGFSYDLLCSYANGTLNETYEEVFSGTCNSSEPYVRPIAENLADCSVSIIAGSVHAGNETLNETYISSVIENNSVIILTTYSGILPGFGRGFVSEQEMDAKIKVEKFNLIVPETPGDYVFSVQLVYNETVIKEAAKNITVTNVSAGAGQEMQRPEILENVSEIDVQLPQIRDSDHDGDPDITDCDPKNPEIHHGAEEICNGMDDNCDGVIDEGFDYDNDTYVTCGEKLDCDDSDKEVNPGAKEICNDGKDNNCDGLKDSEDPNCIVCEDKDKDGYDTCHQPIDCDDNNPNVHPKAKEACDNLVDEDCNGFDEVCITLTSVIQLEKITYVKKEVENEISKNKQAKIIIKFKDIPNKSEIEKEIIPQRETKNFVSVTLDELEMIDLVKKFTADDIELIQLDHPIKLALDDVVNQTGVSLVWDLNATGKGQSVCVIDSGIDYNHANLSDKYIDGYDFVNNDNDPMDDYGHGTYVSGIIAGIGPDAKIVAVKVFGNEGSGYESDIIAGIDYCVQNKDAYSISVMLMSFGGWIFNTSCYCDSNLVANESNFAVSQGIFAVAASGNDAGEYLKAPACGSNVTSVGATDKNDSIADFTNIEPLLDLLAPGVHVTSAKMGGGYETKSGTSASAAVVAGIASLVLEKENLAPLDLQYRLRSTGMIIESNGTGYPRIDAYAAATKNTTNNPEEQQGNQCDGTWEGQEPLLTCSTCNGCEDYFCWVYYICLEPPCAGGCPDGCDVDAEVCDKTCGAECEIDADCPSDGWYCNGETREHWNYYCDTSYCTGCNCDHTTDDYGENCDTQGGGCGDGWYYCSNAYTRANLNWYCITDDNPGAPCGYTTSGTENCYDVCADGCASYNSCTDPSGCSVSYCSGYHDCGSYSCNNGCTTTCDQTCGATCDQDSDCTADTCSGSCPGCLWNDSSCDSACDCAMTQRNPDTTSSRCTGCSQTWNAGGNGDCSGESGCLTDCCGDDSGEGYRSCTKNTSTLSWTCAAANDTCCNAATDCVDPMNNSCATAGTGWNIYGSQTNDTYAYCNTTGGWQDCDDNYAGCGATYCGNASGVKCGAGTGCSAMGEYGDSATKECCGDDSGENYLYRIAHTSMDNGWTTNTSDYACCNTTTDCVRNSICYPSGTAPLDADGDGDTDYCSSNYWYDCNTDLQCSTGSCVSSDCADYADCTGTLASPCDMCDVDAANVTIQLPGGSTAGPYQMVFSNTEGSICNQYGWYINETWNYSLGYTLCSVEGTYNASVKFHAEGATWVWEYAPSTTIYTVSWDTDQNWCNCKVGATACNGGSCYYSSGLAWESGTNSNCCGDDTGENYTYRIADTTMGSWTTNTSDRVCCNASSKCVANGLCYANQSIADVDSNGDTDYCLVGLNGSWYDCNSTADCLAGYRCENRDCVADVNITLNSPVSGYNTTYSITFNATVVASPDLANVSLYGNWSASGWHRNETNSSGTNNTDYIFAKSLASYADGYYKWAIHACNSYGGCKFSENRTFRLDATPPTPNPATIVFVNSTYYANMTVNATLASDAGIGGVEYLFNETTGSSGSTNSSWQSSRLYTDESLSSNTSYCYIVQYRDALNNTGTASSQACNYTLAEPPTITSVLCGSTAGNYYCNVTFSMGSNPAGTLNYIDETTGSSGGSDRDWNSSTAMYQDTGLATGTQYCYRIMAKNANNFNTSYSSTTCDYTSYLLITETVNPNTTYPNQIVYVYGHINLSNGTDVMNYPFNLWLNGSAMSMLNLTAYGSYNNNLNFIHTSSNDWDGGTFANTTYDSENVTLNTTEITAETSLVALYHFSGNEGVELPAETGTTGMMGLWHLNDNNLSDGSGNGNNGVAKGSIDCTGDEGVFDDGCYFDGTDDYIDAGGGSTLNITSNLTIEAWVKVASLISDKWIIDKSSTDYNHGYLLRLSTPENVIFSRMGNGTAANSSYLVPIAAGQWYHVVSTYNGTHIRIFVNGTEYGTPSYLPGGISHANSGNLTIGSNGTAVFFIGNIDEVAIYNRTLSDAEILAHYQRGRVNDSSGFGNNGQLIGAVQAAGKINRSLAFDGSNDYINVSDNAVLNPTNVTVVAWIKTSTTTDNIFVRKYDANSPYYGYALRVGVPAASKLGAWMGGTYWVGGNTNINDSQWHHVAASCNGTNIILYVDGAQDNSSSQACNTSAVAGTPLYIGSYAASSYPYNGTLDEVAIYNRSLTAAEIGALYQKQRCGYFYCNGTFESEIVNANAAAQWKNLSWTEPYRYGDDLPNNNEVESANVNMTGNVLLMHFNNQSAYGENSTLAYDFSGTGNNGTINGSTWTSSGKLGAGALVFDGSNDRINVSDSNSLDITGAITIEAWIYPRSFGLNDLGRILQKDLAYALYISNNSAYPKSIVFVLWNSTTSKILYTPYYSIETNKWQHIAALYNGSYMSLYVNSVLINSTAWTATINTTATPLYIGDRYDLTRVFDGYLDEVVIYNRTLSASEVYNHYMRGLDLKFQARSCDDAACSGESYIGPNGSTSDYFTNGSKIYSLANVSDNQYFQYKAYLSTQNTNTNSTPYLQEVIINYTALVTDASGNYNYSFAAPTAGTYPVVVNATYYGSYGNNSMNLTVMNVTLSITETLDPTTAQASSTVFVYGRMNLSNGTIASNYPLNIWLNGSLLTTRNVTAYGTYVSGLNFTQTNNWNSGSNYYFWNATYDSENVTLNTTETLNDPNAVLIYHLNNDSSLGENNTHFVDVSSGGNNGTCSVAGCPTLTSLGKLRKAYTFDGSDDYIYTNDSFSNPLNFTISVWFRTSSASGTKIVGFEDAQSGTGGTTYDRHIYMGTDGKIYFSWYTGSIVEITSTTTLNNGAWHHAVGAYNSSGGGRLYIDGVLQGSNTGTAQNYAGYWRIGSYKLNAWTNAVDGYFNGVIDEVAIYNRTLTQAEIQQTYENQRCGYYYCNGSYRSNIFDAGTNVEWKNISWTEPYPYGDEVVAESATQGLYHFSANEGVQKSAESGLTGLWHLNDNTLTDSSGYGNTCTAESSLDCTNDRGVFDDGCDFDGTNSYALNCGTSSSIRPTGALSISAWIYSLKQADGDKPVVTTYHYSATAADVRGYTFAKAWGNDRFNFYVYNSSGNSSVAYMNNLLNTSNGKWVHVVGVYSPGQYVKLYVNGTIAMNTTTNVISAIAYSTEAVKMGIRSDSGQYPWNGSIDEVIIWNRTLSDTEVWDLYTRGRAADSSNNANNAHLGGSLNASGVIGNALSFDGSNDYVETADNNILDNVQNGSVEAWFKTTNGNNGVIVGYTTSYALSSNFVWRVRLNVTEMAWNYGGAAGNWNTINGTTKMNDGKWHHVVFTSNGVTRNKIYLDGVEETTTFTSSGSSTDDKNWTYGVDYVSTYNHHVNIGALMRSAPQGYFNGQIDEVVIYNRTLSASEVYNHYMRGLQLKFRMTTCRTSDCSDQASMLGPDLTTSTYFTNSSGNSLANFTNVTRYFQWRAYFENFDNSGITPYLQDFTVNYTGILTNASGYYNYSFTAPATEGTYPVVVNSTFLNIYGNNSQNLIVLNYIINGGSATACNATSKCLLIMNSTGSTKARMDKSGNVDVKGNYISSQASLSPPTGSFIIKDSGGNTVLFINRTGDLATRGAFYMQSSPAPSGNNDFIIKNSTDSVVGYIDGGTGSMYFKGVLHYNSSF